MNQTLQKIIAKLNNEINAIKVAYQRVGSNLPVFTKYGEANTIANKCHYEFSYGGQSFNFDEWNIEVVEVIFTTTSGANTLATIEVATDNPGKSVFVKRKTFSGGAKWRVYVYPNGAGYAWRSTKVNVQVHSVIDGSISVEAI